MKKSFYSLVACAVLCLAACTEKGPDENGGNKDYVDFSGGKINLVLDLNSLGHLYLTAPFIVLLK